MKKWLRIGLLIAWILIGLALYTSLFFSHQLRVELRWTFFNAEAAIGFWRNISFAGAVGIGIACSTFDTISWFIIFEMLKSIYPKSIQR